MSKTDNWPQAPILARLPEVAQLGRQYDTDLLLKDLAELSGAQWIQPRIVSGDGLGHYVTDLDWRSISLRSVGGDPDRNDAGGPGLAEFADTPRLARTPYFAQLLADIPAPLRSVRLMALGPGAESPYHNDTKYGLPWGTLRLHIPLVTTPGAVLLIGDGTYRWQPGALWYADFTRMHLVRNADQVVRIHMVIDCQPTAQLLKLFPAEFQSQQVYDNTLFAVDEVPLSEGELGLLRCTFDLPKSFRSFEEANGTFTLDQETSLAAIDRLDDGLGLYVAGEAVFKLVHLGAGEFRFAGWSRERTIQVLANQTGSPRVRLSSRVGAVTRTLELPCTHLGVRDQVVTTAGFGAQPVRREPVARSVAQSA